MKNKKPKTVRPPYQKNLETKKHPAAAHPVIFKMDAEQFGLIREEIQTIFCALDDIGLRRRGGGGASPGALEMMAMELKEIKDHLENVASTLASKLS